MTRNDERGIVRVCAQCANSCKQNATCVVVSRMSFEKGEDKQQKKRGNPG